MHQHRAETASLYLFSQGGGKEKTQKANVQKAPRRVRGAGRRASNQRLTAEVAPPIITVVVAVTCGVTST